MIFQLRKEVAGIYTGIAIWIVLVLLLMAGMYFFGEVTSAVTVAVLVIANHLRYYIQNLEVAAEIVNEKLSVFVDDPSVVLFHALGIVALILSAFSVFLGWGAIFPTLLIVAIILAYMRILS